MNVDDTILSENHGGPRRTPRLIVIHTTESAEVTGGARAIARYFQPESVDASAHIVVDAEEIIRVVPDRLVAYTAKGANDDGLQVETVGRAGQGQAGWADDYSQSMLRKLAYVCREWAAEYGIPIRRLTTADVKAGKHGICGHVNISEAYRQSTHTDPGPTFPWAQLLALIEGDDMDWSDNIPLTPASALTFKRKEEQVEVLLSWIARDARLARESAARAEAYSKAAAEKSGLTPADLAAIAATVDQAIADGVDVNVTVT